MAIKFAILYYKNAKTEQAPSSHHRGIPSVIYKLLCLKELIWAWKDHFDKSLIASVQFKIN